MKDMTSSAKKANSSWHAEKKMIVTHLSGNIDDTDIDAWEKSLQKVLSQIETGGSFKIFVNLHGFKAVNFEVHKKFRTIIPLTLAAYGWRVGYLDMFGDEAKKLQVFNTRGISCVAAVHCHQDSSKILLYESRYSRPNEHYFTDPFQAEQIESFSI